MPSGGFFNGSRDNHSPAGRLAGGGFSRIACQIQQCLAQQTLVAEDFGKRGFRRNRDVRHCFAQLGDNALDHRLQAHHLIGDLGRARES